ncbi:MAG TPA: carboxypeptidase-like regulatory domain-containing protein [Verrucomicrobiae bacterium]|nr:carboxypeptidase-like regulatory domain-containing protein [Verrucomicrobiae bacterium]
MNSNASWRRVLVGAVCFAAGLRMTGAVTLSVSPNSVSALYQGPITVQINGLTNGETVLVERYIDVNTNGIVDAGEPLVQSFVLTDGQVALIGGVRNGNVPGDNDLTANGQITATLNFADSPEFGRGAASYLFRVSSPGGHFAPLQQSLTVTPGAYTQQVTGNVSSGGSPLAHAMVAVLVPMGHNQKFGAGTVADASGNFSLPVSNGTYVVVAFKPGYIGNFGTGPMITVSGADTNVSVPLTPANLTVSGTLTDASNSIPVPGVQFFISSTNNEYAVFFTDPQGNFSANLVTGQWQADSSDSSLTLGGYFRSQNKAQIGVGTGNVAGISLTCFKGTAMIYGSLKDDSNTPLAGILLNSSDNGNLYTSSSVTDTNGNFWVVGTAGLWNLGPSTDDSGLPANDVLQYVQIQLSNGQAVQTNLVAHQPSAWLAGRATDSNNNPISSGSILAFGTNNVMSSAQLAGDGSFALPVSGGTWSVALENGAAASANVVAPQINVNITDGVSISNFTYVAPISTRTISGWVRTAAGTNITGLNVFGGAWINGTNYIAGVRTDNGGNYSMPVLAGVWSVGLDSQGLAQRGYGSVSSQNADTTSGNKTLNFVVGLPPAPPTLSQVTFVPGRGFQFLLSGTSGQNYTIQYASNPAATTWNILYVTNSPSNPLMVTDPSLPGAARFYRVLVGP